MKRFLEIEPAGRMGLIAVRFHARGAYFFFERPLNELAAGIVDLEDIWKDRAGTDYPGYFDVGDTQELAKLLARAETSPRYLAELRSKSKGLVLLIDPAREELAWSDLISELRLTKNP